jgi:hypothetical protein
MMDASSSSSGETQQVLIPAKADSNEKVIGVIPEEFATNVIGTFKKRKGTFLRVFRGKISSFDSFLFLFRQCMMRFLGMTPFEQLPFWN